MAGCCSDGQSAVTQVCTAASVLNLERPGYAGIPVLCVRQATLGKLQSRFRTTDADSPYQKRKPVAAPKSTTPPSLLEFGLRSSPKPAAQRCRALGLHVSSCTSYLLPSVVSGYRSLRQSTSKWCSKKNRHKGDVTVQRSQQQPTA